MPRFPSVLAPRRLPLEGTLAVPWGPLRPSRSGPQHTPSPHFGTSDNSTFWSPWDGGDNVHLAVGAAAAPLPSRPALGNAYVTPSHDWNVGGPGGWGADWPTVIKGPRGPYYAFGQPTPGQGIPAAGPQVRLSLPGLPPPQPFLGGAR